MHYYCHSDNTNYVFVSTRSLTLRILPAMRHKCNFYLTNFHKVVCPKQLTLRLEVSHTLGKEFISGKNPIIINFTFDYKYAVIDIK